MQNQNQTHVQRDPNDFKPGKFHPALKLIPELAQDSEEFLALAAAVKKCGFIRPLLVDAEGRLVDDHSRSLWRVALRWQLTAVPCLVTPEPMLALIHSLKDVRHMTKSAIAYLLLPVVENQVKAALAVHREKLAKGQYLTVPASGGNSAVPEAPTVPKLCEELGFSEDMFNRARNVHGLFADTTVYTFDVVGGAVDGGVRRCTLKEYFEPRILQTPVGGEHEQNRPMGLGAVISAVAGLRATKDKTRADTRGQLQLALDGFNTFTHRMLKLSPDEIRRNVSGWLDKNEDKWTEEQLEQLESLGQTIREKARELRKAKTA